MTKHSLTRLIYITTLMLCTLPAISQSSKTIAGTWQNMSNPEKQVEIQQQDNGQFIGKIVNDHSKHSQNGFIVFKNLVWKDKTSVYQGLLVKPEDNKEFPVNIQLENKNLFEFKVGKYFLSREFKFKRLK